MFWELGEFAEGGGIEVEELGSRGGMGEETC